ncbi:MAG TPA: hypothetical protein ENJ01_07475 [Gammaproteobacteria bacterium]|nr:hypothetical protein [Gammaproteobacteria bacterium]
MDPIALHHADPRTVVASRPTAEDRHTSAEPRVARAGRGERSEETGREDETSLRRLRARDREVRAHENAHRAVGGRFVRGGHLDTQRGPDGRLYAIGGDVRIDVAPIPGDAAATLEKAVIVQRAALAPVDPSPQDRNVASRAARMAASARAELARQRHEGEENAPPARATGAGLYASLASEPEPQAIDLVV